MKSVKRAISFRPGVWADIARMTGEDPDRVSELVDTAVAYYIKLQEALQRADQWDAENGSPTAGEIAEADAILDSAGVVRGPEIPRWQA